MMASSFKRVFRGCQRQLVGGQIYLRTFFQHFADGVIEFVKLWVGTHHAGHCQSFNFQFSARKFTLSAKAVTHVAGNHHLFPKADFWRVFIAGNRLTVNTFQYKPVML